MKPLSQALPGQVFCVRLDAEGEDAVRLKRMGICEGRELRILQVGDPMILLCSGARIGLSRALAEHVQVQPAAPAATGSTGAAGAMERDQ
jgi:Fe2+ transport system protein FeoA